MVDLSIRLVFIILVIAVQQREQSLLSRSRGKGVGREYKQRGTRSKLEAQQRGEQQDEALSQLRPAFEDYLMYTRVKYRVQNLSRPRLTRQV